MISVDPNCQPRAKSMNSRECYNPDGTWIGLVVFFQTLKLMKIIFKKFIFLLSSQTLTFVILIRQLAVNNAPAYSLDLDLWTL